MKIIRRHCWVVYWGKNLLNGFGIHGKINGLVLGLRLGET